jgi:hypothetical protein
VGQNQWEEINFVPAGTPGGLNFGWNCKEGTHNYEPQHCDTNTVLTDPIFEYPHSCNPCPDGRGASVSGGFVYRGTQNPLLVGQYICADYISDYMWMIEPTGSNPPSADVIVQNAGGMIADVVTFGEDDAGELYAASLNGTLYLVSEINGLPIQWSAIGSSRVKNGNKVEWTIHETYGIDHFEVERSLTSDFINYTSLGHILPVQDQMNYSFLDLYNHSIGVYYRVVAYLQDGSKEYSPITRLLPDPVSKPALVFDAGQNIWRVSLPEIWQTGEMILLDLQGKEVFRRNLSKEKMVELGPPIVPGVYFIQVHAGTDTWSDKVVL